MRQVPHKEQYDGNRPSKDNLLVVPHIGKSHDLLEQGKAKPSVQEPPIDFRQFRYRLSQQAFNVYKLINLSGKPPFLLKAWPGRQQNTED